MSRKSGDRRLIRELCGHALSADDRPGDTTCGASGVGAPCAGVAECPWLRELIELAQELEIGRFSTGAVSVHLSERELARCDGEVFDD